MDPASQRLETGYESIYVDVWRPDLLKLSDGAIYTKFFTDSWRKPPLLKEHLLPAIFKNRRFIAWAAGLAIDRLGNAMYMVVLPLMVYHMTSSLKSMAIITACQFLPRVFPGIYVGSLVDISSKRRVFFSALIFQFAIGTLTAILYSVDALPFILLCLFAAATSIGFEVYRTTEMTLIPIMFAEQRVEATTILSSIHTAMLMAGPLLGAVLLKHFSYSTLLVVNAIK